MEVRVGIRDNALQENSMKAKEHALVRAVVNLAF